MKWFLDDKSLYMWQSVEMQAELYWNSFMKRFLDDKPLYVWQSFEMLVSPGDNVLVESPTYSGALASVSILPLLRIKKKFSTSTNSKMQNRFHFLHFWVLTHQSRPTAFWLKLQWSRYHHSWRLSAVKVDFYWFWFVM